jgi:secreted trypsin-like serine protease
VHWCGAVFIAPEFDKDGRFVSWNVESDQPVWALTAAHCLHDRNGNLLPESYFEVWGGALDLSKKDAGNGEIQKVTAILLPGGSSSIGRFNIQTLENDVALLKLAPSTRKISKSSRLSIRFPTANELEWIYAPYTALYTAGWGRTETGYNSPGLMEVRLPLVAKDFCQAKFAPFGDTLKPGMICAGFTSGQYDSCSGDSGGPLFYRQVEGGGTDVAVLVGVVSAGRGCGNRDLFGIYSSTSYFENWVRAAIQKHQ